MIDVETDDTLVSARVIQLAAVAFDWRTIDDVMTLLEDESRWMCASISHYTAGTVGADTERWWRNDADAFKARHMIEAPVKRGIANVLRELVAFCAQWLTPDGGVWARGPAFDLAILRKLFADRGITIPWSHRQEYCSRTVLHVLAQLGAVYRQADASNFGLQKHYALHDAITEAVTVESAYKGLELSVVSSRFPVEGKQDGITGRVGLARQ